MSTPLTAARRTAPVPENKQTTLGLYLTAREAFEMWAANPQSVKILDVRTPEEYIFVGHAEMATNIPFAFQTYDWNASMGIFGMAPNPDFVARVKEWAKATDTLLVMCRSGTRSAMAVNLLAQAGYTKAYNVVDGLEGDKVDDPASPLHGKRARNGWKNSGNPWTLRVEPERMRLPRH